VTDPSAVTTPLIATTSEPDDPVAATNLDGSGFAPVLAAGTYTVSEDLTSVNSAGGGTWALTNFNCDGEAGTPVPNNPTAFTFAYPPSTPLPAPGDSLECTFTNTFTPDGTLTITKTTTGGVGTTDFVVSPVADPTDTDVPGDATDPVLSATTTQAGVAATAAQTSGSPLDPLAPGRYSIVEEGPQSSGLGTWAPVSIVCNGVSSDPTASDVLVTITATDPHVTCAFTNAFTPVEQGPSTSTTAAATATTAAPTGPALAATGTDVRVPLALALVLALAGSTLLVIDRLRRTRRAVPLHRDDDQPG
jgi:hypothetical protein